MMTKQNGYKLLLIEDDDLDRMAFLKMLGNQNIPFDCIAAESVKQAIEDINTCNFDIIISDFLLGDGTAFEILSVAKNIPVIIVTGAGDEGIAIKAWKEGAYDYLIKDVDRNYLKTAVITIQNALKRKQVEDKLLLLSHAITNTNDCVYITDLENKIVFVNNAFCKNYGYKEDEILGEHSDILLSYLNDNIHALSGWETGHWHKRKDGSEFPVSLLTSVVKDETGSGIAYLGIARDISDMVFVESKLRAINNELKPGYH